ncbi:chorismate mutase [Streptomyces sulphureus]|uniref:chorismate mutase n=1 Tax=Streptomyces sulphureus TaxID=47758 RepID=UPI00036E28F2|nr:chorismate mutase [Streptomyces sulphureus]
MSTTTRTRTTDDAGENGPTTAQPAPGTPGVAAGRAEIDALDERIVALVRERIEVSVRVQQEKIAAGGGRVDLAREMQVLDRYRGHLGRPGTELGMVLLRLSRGRD